MTTISLKIQRIVWALGLVTSSALTGCATTKPPDISHFVELRHTVGTPFSSDLIEAITSLTPDSCISLELETMAVCLNHGKYYLAPVVSGQPQHLGRVFLGFNSQEAITTAIHVRDYVVTQYGKGNPQLYPAKGKETEAPPEVSPPTQSISVDQASDTATQGSGAQEVQAILAANAEPPPQPQNKEALPVPLPEIEAAAPPQQAQMPAQKFREEHWITEVWGDGKYLLFEDSTVWEVDSLDTIHTSLWLPMEKVLLLGTTYGGMAIAKIVNTDENEDVDGTYMGSAVLQTRIDGEFEGWEGDTVFVMESGHVFQQSGYSYRYRYAYRPRVLIVDRGRFFSMIVDRIDESLDVILLK